MWLYKNHKQAMAFAHNFALSSKMRTRVYKSVTGNWVVTLANIEPGQ